MNYPNATLGGGEAVAKRMPAYEMLAVRLNKSVAHTEDAIQRLFDRLTPYATPEQKDHTGKAITGAHPAALQVLSEASDRLDTVNAMLESLLNRLEL